MAAPEREQHGGLITPSFDREYRSHVPAVSGCDGRIHFVEAHGSGVADGDALEEWLSGALALIVLCGAFVRHGLPSLAQFGIAVLARSDGAIDAELFNRQAGALSIGAFELFGRDQCLRHWWEYRTTNWPSSDVSRREA